MDESRLINTLFADYPAGKFFNSSKLRRNLLRRKKQDPGERGRCLGMFARGFLPAGMTFLHDNTILCAVDNPAKACSTCCKEFPSGRCQTWTSCCEMKFCSRLCWERAGLYHKLQCGRDLKDYEYAKARPLVSAEKATDDRALLRVLVTLVADNAPHPLQSFVMGALTASYDRDDAEGFSLAADIVRPIDMLTRLGVDVFTNSAYDTWVIMTILARIRNNSRESHINGRHLIAINPLFSFFNHNCQPNAVHDAGDADSSSTLKMKTTSSIKAKEEIFISYLHGDALQWPRQERNELLRQ